MSADTWASVRPIRGICPEWSCRATRSAAAPAATSAAISLASLLIRSAPTTSTARTKLAPGTSGNSSTKNLAHIWSPTAIDFAPPSNLATIATGFSVSPHAVIEKTPGCGVTRATSSRGTTIVTSPL